MGTKNFTHLHVHTEYSLLDGSAKISELVDRAVELGMTSLAVTDHGAMFGAIEFYKKAKAKGIKPIIGCEVYVAHNSRFDKGARGGYNHLVLLAETNEGYHNLMKLVSFGYTEGFYYKPRIDKELMKKYHKGIIACSACLAGELPKSIMEGNLERAKEVALEHIEIFGKDNYFLEIQDHGIREQKMVNNEIIKISKELNIPLVATNDSHYIYKDDAKPHDILLCIQTARKVHDTDRMKYFGNQFYFKSYDEMLKLFPEVPEALDNTMEIAKRCNVDIKFHELKLPEYNVPDGKSAKEYLREVCYSNFYEKYPNYTNNIKERLEYELKIITDMGFVDYFLIVWDFIKYAKDNNIMVGPGRGSAAGSIVSYCLSITTIDPIKYDLIFERFLNPERVSMPDIDIDFCYVRRQEVIEYVIKKYGYDNVAQIITFGTMAARAAIKDVGRALDVSIQNVEKITKLIPNDLGITIKEALDKEPQLLSLYETDENVKKIIDTSIRLEGLPRHSSTHAAGVVICKEPVVEYVPLSSKDEQINTQYTMGILEELGILKMDFLGLRTLTVIQNAVLEIKRNHNISINIDEISLEDEAVYNLISKGKTEGIFQLESAGMKQFMKNLKPTCIEDLIAGISLYRPGPMDFIPKYIKGKNSDGNINYVHEKLEPILKKTYGCIVYQEQVMEIVRVLAGYSLGRSDLVRRAMSKKKTDVMAEERKNFIYGIEGEVAGCIANGIPENIAEKIFSEMTDFAKYAFNKSHAACYALVGYQTAWLKTHYPVEFMAALMTSVKDSSDKITGYIESCKKMNIKILPPDINEGYRDFSVCDDGIRFALSAIKNVGGVAVDNFILEREKNGKYKSLHDLCVRSNGKVLKKQFLESMIKAGAFDSFGGNRKQYMAIYESVMSDINSSRKNNIAGQISMFDLFEDLKENTNEASDSPKDDLPDLPEFTDKEKLSMEKEVLSIYLSGHPLSEYEKVLKRKISHTSNDFNDDNDELIDNNDKNYISEGLNVAVGGIINEVKILQTKRGDKMATFLLEDFRGIIKILLFPKAYSYFSQVLQKENIVVVRGKASFLDNDKKVIADSIEVVTLDEQYPFKLWLKIKGDNDNYIKEIKEVLEANIGGVPIYLYNETTKIKSKFKNHGLDISGQGIQELKEILGDDNVVLVEAKT